MRALAVVGLALAAGITWVFGLGADSANAETIRFKFITTPPKMLICEQGAVTVQVKVTPAQRGRVVWLSRWNTGRWIDDSKATTNSAGIAELPIRTKCARGWNGMRKVEFRLWAVDQDTDKWAFSKPFVSKLYRLAGFKSLGFESCTALPVGEPCIVAAHPATNAFNVYNDTYTIEVWSIDPETSTFIERLYLFDEVAEGYSIQIFEDPFAFGISSASGPYSTTVVMILNDSNGEPVAWSKEFPIAWV